MANISDKTNLTEHTGVVNETGVAGANWISQINAGGTVYDIATHHGITFREGNGGATTTWNGLSDIEVIIPSITDIVQSPIEFAGTVAGGKIEWNATHGDEPKTGYLVFVTEDCEFEGHAVEAGDMAIYDGTKWNIVSGENQVKIVGETDSTIADGNRTVVKVGAAKDVLVVEGKALSLTLDYTDLDKHVSLSKGKETEVVLDKLTVGSVGINLNKGVDIPTTIGSEKSFLKATELEDGTVNFTNATGLVTGITWGAFNAGTATTSEKNSEQTLEVTGGNLNLSSKQQSGAFVDSVSINPVAFKTANTGEAGSISMVTGITKKDGQEFLKGVHVTGEGETADLTFDGYMTTTKDNVKFVEGLAGNLNPVTSITAGDFKLTAGSSLATGFGNESTSGEVISSVTVTANNDTSVLNTAKVENHVLSFSSTNVTSGVSTSCSYKSLTKTGFEYTAPAATTTSFVTSGFTKGSGVNYTFDKANETTYETTSAHWKLDTPALDVTYGSYSFTASGMKANVPEGTFVTSVTPGTLPSLAESTVTKTNITGSVNTALKTEEFKFNALNANSINMPGAYSLETVDEGGQITVGKNGDIAANNATIDLSDYITGVTISETTVK